jgi:multicomponent Na+:H+ antiporter subunit D
VSAVAWDQLLPLLLPLSSFIPATLILMIKEHKKRFRTIVNLAGAIVKLVILAGIAYGIYYDDRRYEVRFPLVADLEFVFRIDDLSMLFLTLSAVLWLLTTVYAIGYLEGSPHRKRFFCFFSLCVTATMGIAQAGNLITFLIFYEMLTLVTYPLVVHRGTANALRAGRVYLVYTLFGGTLLLLGTAWIHVIAGPADFVRGGFLAPALGAGSGRLVVVFVLLLIGLGVKTALVPLHGWLPQAMVAPAPVSALLHAVAVVKAGAFGVARVVYDVFGSDVARQLGVLLPLAVVASFTIIYASIRALYQDDIKRRLAYSTISQVSYIVLGIALWGPIGTIGALAHLVHQGIMKITLFFCAGNLAEELKIHKVSELDGVGRVMPLTMAAFTVGAFGMIGLPPVAGFVSKWYLGLGAASSGQYEFIGVLFASSLLNALYFLPIVRAAWFKEPSSAVQSALASRAGRERRPEISWLLLGPTLITAAFSIATGVFAGSRFSPLAAAKVIMEGVYPP